MMPLPPMDASRRARLALVLVPRHLEHLQEEVGPVEPLGEHLRVLHQQRADDVLAHLGGGGGGERHGARGPQALAHLAQLRVVRPEVVAPLRDAVRLVHREAAPRPPAPGRRGRRGCESARAPRRRACTRPARMRRDALGALQLRQGRVDERGRDAPRGQLLHLVLHQRDERRDDERHALAAASPAAGSTGSCPRPWASPPRCCAR